MSSFEEDPLAALALQLQQESPDIYTSIKNLVAYLLGKAHAGVPGLTGVLSGVNAMPFAKELLGAIQSHELPPLEAFCASYPQGEQSGADRLDAILRYKALHGLHLRGRGGGRISRLFGRKYFLWSGAWGEIRALAAQRMGRLKGEGEGEIELFLSTYEEALGLEGGVGGLGGPGQGEGEGGLEGGMKSGSGASSSGASASGCHINIDAVVSEETALLRQLIWATVQTSTLCWLAGSRQDWQQQPSGRGKGRHGSRKTKRRRREREGEGEGGRVAIALRSCRY